MMFDFQMYSVWILIKHVFIRFYTTYILVNVFGQVSGSIYSSLPSDMVLTSDTTLYCVTENKDTPQVMWSYVDLDGTRTDLTSTTDTNTGVSILKVFTTQPGYYTCEVPQNGDMSTGTYTVGLLNTNLYTGKYRFFM